MKRFVALFALSAFILTAAPSFAAEPPFPVRPIQVIVPYNAGGGTDLSVRILSEVIKKHLPRGIVVVNQPGGGGSIGTSAVSHAKPDGYTLGTGSQGPVALLPHYGGIDYDKDSFEYIGLLGRNLMVVAAHKNSPVQTAQEFLDYAKANPGKLSVGVSGAGGANHLLVEGFAKMAGISVKSMPFNGGSQAITNCVGGHLDTTTGHPAEVMNHVKSGALKVLFVLEPERIADFPDAPTTREMGIDFQWASWKGIIGPKGMPDHVVKTLTDAFGKALQDPDFIKKMLDLGDTPDYMTGEQFKALVDSDSAKAEGVIRDLGMYGMNAKKN